MHAPPLVPHPNGGVQTIDKKTTTYLVIIYEPKLINYNIKTDFQLIYKHKPLIINVLHILWIAVCSVLKYYTFKNKLLNYSSIQLYFR